MTLADDGLTAVCNICLGSLVFNKRSTTNLLRHLRVHHPLALFEDEEKQSAPEDMQDDKSTVRLRAVTASHASTCETAIEPTLSTSDSIEKHEPVSPVGLDEPESPVGLDELVSPVGLVGLDNSSFDSPSCRPTVIGSLRNREIDACILKLVTTDLQPLSIVENTAFRELLTEMDPSYEIVSKKRLSQQLLPEKYNAEKAKLMQEVEEVEYISITVDCWTSQQTETYMTVTAHFVNTHWKLRSRVLCTTLVEGSHTSENLASVLGQVFQTWGISNKVTTVTTDSTTNLELAVELLQVGHQTCFAHTLNIAVNDAIQNTKDIFAVKSKIKDIIGFFHHSTLANKALKEAHETCQTVPGKLKQDVDTRWNSTFDMLQSYVNQHQQVDTALCLTGNPDMCITAEELHTLQEAMVILEPFYEATLELSTELHTSASKIIPLIYQLRKFTATDGSALARRLNANLNRSFEQVETKTHLGVATILDPRFKRSGFPDLQSSESAVDNLKDRASAIVMPLPHDETSAEGDAVDADPSPAKKRSVLWSSFDSQVRENEMIFSHRLTASELEVRRHLETPCIQRDANPLEWWQDRVDANPRTAVIAKDVLAIPATSVPSERVFSKTGEQFSWWRRNLKAKHVDMMLFLNSIRD